MTDIDWMKRKYAIDHLCKLFGIVQPECEEVLRNGLDWQKTRIWVRNKLGEEGPAHELLIDEPSVCRLVFEEVEGKEPIILEGFGRLSEDLSQLDEYDLELNVRQAETHFEKHGYSRRSGLACSVVSSADPLRKTGRPRKTDYIALEDDALNEQISGDGFFNQKDFDDWVTQRAMDNDMCVPGRTSLQDMFKSVLKRARDWQHREAISREAQDQ